MLYHLKSYLRPRRYFKHVFCKMQIGNWQGKWRIHREWTQRLDTAIRDFQKLSENGWQQQEIQRYINIEWFPKPLVSFHIQIIVIPMDCRTMKRALQQLKKKKTFLLNSNEKNWLIHVNGQLQNPKRVGTVFFFLTLESQVILYKSLQTNVINKYYLITSFHMTAKFSEKLVQFSSQKNLKYNSQWQQLE
jgi:hypothetical protein